MHFYAHFSSAMLLDNIRCWCDTQEIWLRESYFLSPRLIFESGSQAKGIGLVPTTRTTVSLLCWVCLHNRWRMECCHIYKFIVLSCCGTSISECTGAVRALFWISPGHPMQQWPLKLTLSFGKPSIAFMGTQDKSLTSRPWVKITKANNQSFSDIQTLYTVLSFLFV